MENKIRELRRLSHLSQEDVAHIAHVSRQTINAIENDKYDPELTLAFKLAETLGTTVDELFNYQPTVVKRKENDVFWCEKYQCVLLKNVTLSIEKGKTTAIIGVNGSGKSTILKALGRLIKSDGQVIFDNQPLSQHSNREIARILALLPQSITAPADITVYELVSLGRFPHQKLMQQRLSKEDILFIEELMRETKIWDIRESKISELSGGQKQRVFITMILAQDSEIILLDEPTTYLDLAHQLDILCLLKDLATKRNKTIVYVIHDLNHAARFADNLVLVKDGEVVEEGTVDELFTQKTLKECFGLDVTLGCDTFTKKLMITGVKDA